MVYDGVSDGVRICSSGIITSSIGNGGCIGIISISSDRVGTGGGCGFLELVRVPTFLR